MPREALWVGFWEFFFFFVAGGAGGLGLCGSEGPVGVFEDIQRLGLKNRETQAPTPDAHKIPRFRVGVRFLFGGIVP